MSNENSKVSTRLNNKRSLRPTIISIRDVMRYFADLKKSEGQTVRCLQVGANDGKTNDPLHPYVLGYRWQSILVEPQVNVFEHELRKTYAGVDNVHLENVAIVNSNTASMDFYVLAFTNERWATGLASFDRHTLEKHVELGWVDKIAREHNTAVPEKREDYIKSIKVEATSTSRLLQKHGFESLDVFCIDTEGYDFEILKNLDWGKYQPQLVLFESRHLSDDDFLAAQQFLRNKGYKVYWERGDTLAIRFHLPWLKMARFSATAFLRKI